MALDARDHPEVPDTGLTLRQYYVMVGLGAFVTTIAQREPRVRDHDERAQLRAEELGRDRLVAPRQLRLALRRARVAQRGHHRAPARVHSAAAAPALAASGR